MGEPTQQDSAVSSPAAPGSSSASGATPMPPQPSLKGRAAVAITLLVGFYLLVVAIGALLIAAPYLEWTFVGRLHLYVLALPVLGLSLWKSLYPRRDEFTAPGPSFDASTQPELSAMIDRIADRVGQPRPDERYLINDVNAFVTTRDSRMGIGGRRVIALGVPLLQQVSVDELESVVAHEFGHFHGGDTNLGPVVYQTRAAIGRTLSASHGTVFARLFEAYASLYLRVTQAISRAQEHAADRLAAEVTSPEVAARALARIPTASALLEHYTNAAYVPALAGGVRPPFLEGFARFLGSDHSETVVAEARGAALGEAVAGSFDSHPPIPERIRALGVDPASVADLPPVDVPASTLLQAPEHVEQALLATWLTDAAAAIDAGSWDEVPQRVLVPVWRDEFDQHVRPHQADLGVQQLPSDLDGLDALGGAALAALGQPAHRVQRENVGRSLANAWLAVAALDAGYTPACTPGVPPSFSRGDIEVDLFAAYRTVLDGERQADDFIAELGALGITGIAGSPESTRDNRSASVSPRPSGSLHTTQDEAPRPLPPVRYNAIPPGQRIKKKQLVLDGPLLRWGDEELLADDVTAAAYQLKYTEGSSDLGVFARFSTATKTITIDVKGTGSKSREELVSVFRNIVLWFEQSVETRLVDRYFEELRAGRPVEIGGVTVDGTGLRHKAKHVPFDQIAHVSIEPKNLVILQVADNLRGVKPFATVKSSIDDVVLLPGLIAAAAAEFHG